MDMKSKKIKMGYGKEHRPMRAGDFVKDSVIDDSKFVGNKSAKKMLEF